MHSSTTTYFIINNQSPLTVKVHQESTAHGELKVSKSVLYRMERLIHESNHNTAPPQRHLTTQLETSGDLVDAVHGIPSKEVSRTNGFEGTTVIPVVALDNDSVLAEVVAGETKIVGRDATIGVEEVTVLGEDGLVEANFFSGEAAEV